MNIFISLLINPFYVVDRISKSRSQNKKIIDMVRDVAITVKWILEEFDKRNLNYAVS